MTSLGRNGTIYDLMMLDPIAPTPAVGAAVGQASGDLRAVFAAC